MYSRSRRQSRKKPCVAHGFSCYNADMTTLRAHFDGRVLVPDEPVPFAKDAKLELHVRQIETAEEGGGEEYPRATLVVDPVTGMPVFVGPPGVKIKTITLEDVKRLEDEI